MLDAMKMDVPNPTIHTTRNRGHTPDELADMAIDRIVSISDKMDDPMVQAQARVYKENIRMVLVNCMKQSILSYRTSINAELIKAGHADMAQIIRNL